MKCGNIDSFVHTLTHDPATESVRWQPCAQLLRMQVFMDKTQLSLDSSRLKANRRAKVGTADPSPWRLCSCKPPAWLHSPPCPHRACHMGAASCPDLLLREPLANPTFTMSGPDVAPLTQYGPLVPKAASQRPETTLTMFRAYVVSFVFKLLNCDLFQVSQVQNWSSRDSL